MKRLLALLLCFPLYLSAWTPPIGIPAPAWPADLDLARPSLPSPWSSDIAGFYFIQTSGCSDSGRTYGNPSAPRCSFPSSPAAGSKIVLNGTVSGDHPSIAYSGSSGSPIWIMGYNPASKPTITGVWGTQGSYLIFDSLAFSNAAQDGNLWLEGGHLMVRDSSFADSYDTSNGSCISTSGSNLVFYRNTISQCGNWQYGGSSDIDRHGMKVFGNDIWIVDNTIYHCHGDGIQVADETNAASAVNRIYIGRNESYENYQSGMWLKNATDVIFSQNNIHSLTRNDGFGNAGGTGGQYDPKYVWFIANTVRDANTGIVAAGSSNGGGGPWYAIGNLLYNIAFSPPDCNPWNGGAVLMRNEGGMTALYNTVYNSAPMFSVASGATLTVRDNILAGKPASCNAFENDGATFSHDYNLFSSSAYDPGTEANRVVGDPLFVTAGSNFHLLAGSPAIGRGYASEAAFSAFQSRYGIDIRKDLSGLTRPQAGSWDMGAYEYGTATPSTLIHPRAVAGWR